MSAARKQQIAPTTQEVATAAQPSEAVSIRLEPRDTTCADGIMTRCLASAAD
jgi:hypothetical protein